MADLQHSAHPPLMASLPRLPPEMVEHIVLFLPLKTQFQVANLLNLSYIRDETVLLLRCFSLDRASRHNLIRILNLWKQKQGKPGWELQWWKAREELDGWELKYTEWAAIDRASENVHLDVLQWWRDPEKRR